MSATFEVGVAFDLRKLEANCIDIMYNARKFSAAKYRSLSPSYSALLFYNGKVTLTGTRSMDATELAAVDFCNLLKSQGYTDVAVLNLQVNHCVGAIDLKRRISLPNFYNMNKTECSYEVELFPGLIYKPVSLKATFTLFGSGKIIVTGCATADELYIADALIHSEVNRL